MEILEKQTKDKDDKLRRHQQDIERKDNELFQMKEEINLYKGRCANLQRDIDLSSSAVNKLANDSGSMGEQLGLYKNRVQ